MKVTKGRATAHMLVFYSFIGLFITTILAFAKVIPEYFEHFGTHLGIDQSLLDGLTVIYKIIGNISAAAMILGILLVMTNRFKNQEKAGLGAITTGSFILLVAGVGVSGLLAQFLRMANTVVAYPNLCSASLSGLFPFCICPIFQNGSYGLQGNSNDFCKTIWKGIMVFQ